MTGMQVLNRSQLTFQGRTAFEQLRVGAAPHQATALAYYVQCTLDDAVVSQ